MRQENKIDLGRLEGVVDYVEVKLKNRDKWVKIPIEYIENIKFDDGTLLWEKEKINAKKNL